MQRLCNWLLVECETADPSPFFLLFNFTPNRLFSTANSFFLPKPVAQKPQSSTSGNGDFFLLRLQLFRRLFLLLFSFFFPLPASSIDSIPESREPTPEWDPIAAHEALAPLHWDVEEFDFGVVFEEDEPMTEGEDLRLLFQEESESGEEEDHS